MSNLYTSLLQILQVVQPIMGGTFEYVHTIVLISLIDRHAKYISHDYDLVEIHLVLCYQNQN